MGDDGLQIYNAGSVGVKFIDYIPWDTVDFEASVKDLIIKQAKRKPVVILNDMVEQHYRKEKIPKVSILDKNNVIKRRLSVAFPNYRVRAALKLNEKQALANDQSKSGGTYLFAAIPNSEPYKKTINAVSQSGAPIVGFYLLPVEAANMVKTLSGKLGKKFRSKSTWTIFIGQHHGGGLRQIVTRKGELALTRLTPTVDTDIEPELWVKEVAGELAATMSYLSRFGYKESDGLDIIITSNEACHDLLSQEIRIEGATIHGMTSTQIGGLLGTRLGRQDDKRYADPLHAGYLGRKSKFLLPMESASIDQLTKPRRVASFLIMGLLAGCAYFGFQAFQNWQKNVQVQDELMIAVQQRESLEQEYQRQVERQKALGFDFVLVNNAIEIHKDLNAQKIKPLPIMREIGRALGPDLNLDNIITKLEEEKPTADANNFAPYSPEGQEAEAKRYNSKTVLSISFPPSMDPDLGVQRINNLRDRLAENLPEYEVTILKQVADLSYTGNVVGQAGTASDSGAGPETYAAEIEIRGAVQ